jgi:hypothetical protein
MFNPTTAKSNLLAALAVIEFGNLGIQAGAQSLEIRAAGIKQAGEAFAFFIQELAADADASISAGRIADRDAQAIADTCGDIAGQIQEAAYLVSGAA